MTANQSKNQSILEYVLVIILVAIVVAVALMTLGEEKEDYMGTGAEPALPEELE